jgi:hypothetical protein
MKKGSSSVSEDRLSVILRGAFSGPPTPLKEIPKRDGKPRASGKPQRRLRRQRKNRAA